MFNFIQLHINFIELYLHISKHMYIFAALIYKHVTNIMSKL